MSWGSNARLMYHGRKLAMRKVRRRERGYSTPRSQKASSYSASPQMPCQQPGVSSIQTIDAADRVDTMARWHSSTAFIALFTSVLLANLGVLPPLWIAACLLWFIGSLVCFSWCSGRLEQAKAAAFALAYYQETMRASENVSVSVAIPAMTQKAVVPHQSVPEQHYAQDPPATMQIKVCQVTLPDEHAARNSQLRGIQKQSVSPRKYRSQQDWDNRLREESRWRKAAKNGEVYKDD